MKHKEQPNDRNSLKAALLSKSTRYSSEALNVSPPLIVPVLKPL